MNKKDAAITTILSDLGLRDDKPLSPDQEQLFQKIVNRTPEDDLIDKVNQLFTRNPNLSLDN